MIVLDTGDALIGGGKLGDKTRGEVIVAAMNEIGYDAMTLGPYELSLGLDLLTQRMAEAEFPMLSANVVLSGTQDLLADPYVLLDVGGQKIGVIGLTRQPPAPPAGMQVTDPTAAAKRYVSEVAAKADTVIVLTNLAHPVAQALAQAVPGIDLVVAALPDQQLAEAIRAPQTGTLVAVADLATQGHTGRRLGLLTVTLGPDGSLTGESWQGWWLDKSIADDPDMAALLARYN